MLNVFGVDDSTIKKYLYDHYLTKNSRKIEWLDFANERILMIKGMLCDIEQEVSYSITYNLLAIDYR